MQRIISVKFDQQDVEKSKLLIQYNEFLQLLEPHVSSRTLSILALPQSMDETNLGWFTKLEGQAIPIQNLTESEQQRVKSTLTNRLSDIDSAIKQLLTLPSFTTEQKNILSEWQRRINASGNPLYVINDDPIILYDFDQPLPPPVAPVVPAVPVTPIVAESIAKPFFRWWHYLLLALLLLGLLWLLWYLFFPITKEEPPVVINTPIETVEEQKPVDETPVIQLPPPEEKVEIPEVELPAEKAPETTKVEPTPEPDNTVPPKKTPKCIPKNKLVKDEKTPRLVIVFDNSLSMNLTIAEPIEEVERFARMNPRYFTADMKDQIKRMFRLPSRLSASKEAALTSINRIQSNIDIGLVVLERCPNAREVGFFTSNNRAKLKKQISGLIPVDANDSGTSLYSGVQKASNMLDGVNRDDYILIISDGEDSCTRSNICTLAHAISVKQPRLKINIIDIVGLHRIDCVAESTGGKVFIAQNYKQLIKQMEKVMNKIDLSKPVCE